MKKHLLLLAACGMLYASNANAQTIKHNSYTIYYNPAIKAPDSTSFDLTPEMVSCPSVKRVDAFKADPLLTTGPKPSDFANPAGQPDSLQIDKGHTFSYNSSHCSPINRTECFYVSGMYAQYHGFNNGDWKEFEVEEQRLAALGKIHVINGYIGIQGHLAKGEIIPAYMYKAIYSQGHWIVYIAPNRPWVHGHQINIWLRTAAYLDSKTGLKL